MSEGEKRTIDDIALQCAIVMEITNGFDEALAEQVGPRVAEKLRSMDAGKTYDKEEQRQVIEDVLVTIAELDREVFLKVSKAMTDPEVF